MHRIVHALDSVIITTLVTAASATLAVVDPTAASDDIELRLLLLPLIGALISSGGFILLNPQPETRRIVIGRAVFALFFGVVLPSVLCAVFPALTSFARKPMPLMLLGALIAGGAYVLSKPFTAEMYARAQGVAKAQANRLEKMIDNNQEPPKP